MGQTVPTVLLLNRPTTSASFPHSRVTPADRGAISGLELGEAGEPRGDGGTSSRQCASYRPRFRVKIGASETYACPLMVPCIGCSPLAREGVEIDDARMPTCRGGEVAKCALPLHRPFERLRRAIQNFDTRTYTSTTITFGMPNRGLRRYRES